MKHFANIYNQSFKTKTECLAYCQNLLNSMPVSTTGAIEELPYDVNMFLYELLLLHPRAERKIEHGVKYFLVKKDKMFSNINFVLVDNYGVEEPFSYKKCISKTNTKNDIMYCFRNSISNQIIDFKEKMIEDNKFFCVASKKYFDVELCHINHKTPFSKLLNDFLVSENIDIEKIKVEYPKDTRGCIILDSSILERWNIYHKENAILECMHRKINTRLGTKNIEDCDLSLLCEGI